LKSAVITHDLPKYVWVTEFGTLQSMNHLDPKDKRIFGHAVIDATSSQYQTGALIFHAPGLMLLFSHNVSQPHDNFSNAVVRIANDTAYYPKVRGKVAI
ncbi:MAG: hypothetical protein WBQ17_10810, partial [Rhizomicrobium sp.]